MANVQTAYLGFWAKFWDLCAKAQLTVAPKTYPFKTKVLDKNTAEIYLAEPIHLRDWPWRDGSSKGGIHILVSGRETVLTKNFCVVRSQVKVNYFLLSKKTAMPVESIHYDYDPAQKDHPLFHAQPCGDLIETELLTGSDTFGKFVVKPKQIPHRIKTIKIPTAHIGFTSVLNGLVADHGNATNLADLSGLIKNDASLPKASATSLHERLAADAHSFRSFAWYT